MKKNLVPLTLVTAILSFVYAVLYFIADIIVITTMSDAETGMLLLGVLGIFNILLFFAMITLGIILTVFSAKLPAQTPGKVILLIASIMTIAGFLLGQINILRSIYLIATGVLFIIGMNQYKKNSEQVVEVDIIEF